MGLMLATAIAFPKASAAFGFIWCVGRIMYIRGYAQQGPKGRLVGSIVAHLGDFPLMLLACYVGLCAFF
ncbi:MAG: hypothetical protein SGPRY_012279 [Prymnesium sp.]